MIEKNQWLVIMPVFITTIVPSVSPNDINYILGFGNSSYILGMLIFPTLILIWYFY